MSTRTYIEMVPFKISVFAGSEGESTGYQSLDRFLELSDSPAPEEYYKINDWVFQGDAIIYGSLCPDLLTKKDSNVYYINESEYATGGGLIATFFSNKKEDLEMLCRDWGFDASKIKSGKYAMQKL